MFCLAFFHWMQIDWSSAPSFRLSVDSWRVWYRKGEYKAPHNFYTLFVTFFSTYLLLTYSMEQSPSWEANRFLASQEIPAFYGTQSFITAFTSARHLSLSWVRSIQSLPPHATSWRSILILSSQSGSLSPRHGASSGCWWRNGLQYGG
jgi:hypothetical protein